MPRARVRPAEARNSEAGKKLGGGQETRVGFRELAATPLVQVDHGAVGDVNVNGAIVKVTAELRPSEREAFDVGAIREVAILRGAIAVVVAPSVLPEVPTMEARDEVAKAPGPDEAIAAWFDGLTAPKVDVEAARELALGMLAKEGNQR
jgi:hypothetical protein